MRAYSEDLRRKKIVQAIERAASNTGAARLFGVSLSSSVKRYAVGSPRRDIPGSEEGIRAAPEDRADRPEAPRRRRKGTPSGHHLRQAPFSGTSYGLTPQRLHRPTALEATTGLQPKKRTWERWNERVAEGSLAGDDRRKARCPAARFRRPEGH